MTELEKIFGQGPEPADKVDKILALTERMGRIEGAISSIKYNEELLLAVPEAIKTLAAAKDAVVAELKTL